MPSNTALSSPFHSPFHGSSYRQWSHQDCRFLTGFSLSRSIHGDSAIAASTNPNFSVVLLPPYSFPERRFFLIRKVSYVTDSRFRSKKCRISLPENAIFKTLFPCRNRPVLRSKGRPSGSSTTSRRLQARSMPVRKLSSKPAPGKSSASSSPGKHPRFQGNQASPPVFHDPEPSSEHYEKNLVTCRMMINAAKARTIPTKE